jgi:hypothetical protein
MILAPQVKLDIAQGDSQRPALGSTNLGKSSGITVQDERSNDRTLNRNKYLLQKSGILKFQSVGQNHAVLARRVAGQITIAPYDKRLEGCTILYLKLRPTIAQQGSRSRLQSSHGQRGVLISELTHEVTHNFSMSHAAINHAFQIITLVTVPNAPLTS